MPPINPFLNAFFSSKLLSQCLPASKHILLVPSTEFLLTYKDHETQASYVDLVAYEDFLASHVIRVVEDPPFSIVGNDGPNGKERKSKAKQYTTVSGKTVVVKDAFLYSNKGFTTLSQAQILRDDVYYPDLPETQQWLIYYISRPLLGDPEFLNPVNYGPTLEMQRPDLSEPETVSSSMTSKSEKPDAKTFSHLLDQFPMIARQMQSGLERPFYQFHKDVEQALPSLLHSSTPVTDTYPSNQTLGNGLRLDGSPSSTNSIGGVRDAVVLLDQELRTRRALESLIFSVIENFQLIDKQQLSTLTALPELSGACIERLIEQYVSEQLHENVLFPAVCAKNQIEDTALEIRINQVVHVDVLQMGIVNANDRRGKKELTARIARGVEAFKKIAFANSPQEMLDSLLRTARCLTSSAEHRSCVSAAKSQDEEKLTVTSADTLVSLLLIVVIRSSVHNLQARLTYMRDYIFVDDVESGETGYALSTYEAVLSYLANNSSGLRRASRSNRTLWHAVKRGNMMTLKKILQPQAMMSEDDPDQFDDSGTAETFVDEWKNDHPNENSHHPNGVLSLVPLRLSPQNTGLSNMYSNDNQSRSSRTHTLKHKKRVSMEARSISSSSAQSFGSRTSTIQSSLDNIEVDTSAEQLAQTQDTAGRSVVMMAVVHAQPQSLTYLLGRTDFFSFAALLEDEDNNRSTLLSAAVQLGDRRIVTILLDHLLVHAGDQTILETYFQRQDVNGRSVAHYLVNAPYLITSLGNKMPWKLKDKHGQTPLFTIFRSYDHPDYLEMVEAALPATILCQADGERLHLDEHIDNKRNTLLHIVHHPKIIQRLLYHCDADPNAKNEKHFTPLMMASKFARIDSVRMLFGDTRVDLQARDYRGLTAVELAKDDEVRNHIDDMVLLSTPSGSDGRTTIIVRSTFVEDGTIRLILKSGARNSRSTITVTTCRRSLTDFESLARWLWLEHPSSWLPSVSGFRSPYQLFSRPSRIVLRDIQLRLDSFLRTLLSHPTFATHEMLWEFFLVPDINIDMLAERAKRKVDARSDKLREEYEPIADESVIADIESFMSHARSQVSEVHNAYKILLRRANASRNISSDLAEAHYLASAQLSRSGFVTRTHVEAFTQYTATLTQTEYSPTTQLHYALVSTVSITSALLEALSRPVALIRSFRAVQGSLTKYATSASRSQRWPSALGLLDDARSRILHESQEKIEKAEQDLQNVGCELRYTQQTVAGELAGWQAGHASTVREALRTWAERMVVIEKDRLEGMKRAVRGFRMANRKVP